MPLDKWSVAYFDLWSGHCPNLLREQHLGSRGSTVLDYDWQRTMRSRYEMVRGLVQADRHMSHCAQI